jgi:hypothetical protein
MPFVPKLARTALAVLTLAAIGQQLVLHLGASHDPLNFFSYFTNLSNLFAALVLLLSVFGRPGGWIDVARYLSTVNMAVVGIVFSVLLRNVDLGALLPWVNFVLHYLMPVAIVIDWLLQPPASSLSWKVVVWALVFPAAYLLYAVLRGASIGWYPYPFLNPANVGGHGGVALYALGIAITFLLAGWAFRAIGNRLSSSRNP